ncbi:MAG: hypothetical protein ACE5OS_05910 [Anaerolineae bacterium]
MSVCQNAIGFLAQGLRYYAESSDLSTLAGCTILHLSAGTISGPCGPVGGDENGGSESGDIGRAFIPGPQGRASSEEAIKTFTAVLDRAHVPRTMRQRRGAAIDAGCGQLRRRKMLRVAAVRPFCPQRDTLPATR